MLTYNDIREAHERFCVAVSEHTVTLRKIAAAMLEAYKESLQLPGEIFISEGNERQRYVDTVLMQNGKAEPCSIAALNADEDHRLNFYIRTAVNDDPHLYRFIDLSASVSIQGDDIYVYLDGDKQPLITMLKPAAGRFSDISERIKQKLILHIGRLMPKGIHHQ